MGSGSEPHAERAEPLGRWLAELGVNLLTGGGAGTMAAVSEAFARVSPRAGRIIGILPGAIENTGYRVRPGYPNPWVEIPIYTHLPLSGDRGAERASRNHINVLSSDVIVALPGGAGTHSELQLARHYGKPVIVFGADAPHVPEGIEATDDFSRVQAFVREALGRPA
jgi:uncharacterized protein (TIGR00725 family)